MYNKKKEKMPKTEEEFVEWLYDKVINEPDEEEELLPAEEYSYNVSTEEFVCEVYSAVRDEFEAEVSVEKKRNIIVKLITGEEFIIKIERLNKKNSTLIC